jgi:predicted adenylyl cyclase CyaB
MHINIEIKAHCKHPERIEQLLLDKNAKFIGLDHQIDTYFNTESGRLKLREGKIENNLIHYHRSNQEGPKKSEVTLHKVMPNSSLKIILEKTVGVKVIVDKQRKIFFIENVKFHIDQVKGLGSFVEIEAIDNDGSIGEEELQHQCDFYMNYLGILDTDLIAVSYSDLLMKVSV